MGVSSGKSSKEALGQSQGAQQAKLQLPVRAPPKHSPGQATTLQVINPLPVESLFPAGRRRPETPGASPRASRDRSSGMASRHSAKGMADIKKDSREGGTGWLQRC